MYTIPDIISKELKQLCGIEPIQEKETKEFRLVRSGVYDPSVGKPVSPQGHIFPGMDMIKDTYDKQHGGTEKMIENITGYVPIREKGRATSYQPITEYVRFPNTGSLILTEDQNNLYYFLKLHNKNRDNLNRKAKAGVVYYEVNEEKELALKNNVFDYKIFAGNVLIDIGEEPLRKIVKKLNEFNKARNKTLFDIAGEYGKLLSEVKAHAEAHPIDVLFASDDKISQMRVIADVAADNRWILFNDHEEQRTWIYPLAKSKKASVICKVEIGNRPNRALVDFLMTKDGSVHATELFSKYVENYPIPR